MSGDVIPMKGSWAKAALVIASGGTTTDAGKAAGVTSRTVQRWRADEVQFADAVADARKEFLDDAAGILAQISTKAAQKLGAIIEDSDDRLALAAARVVLDMASRYRQDQSLENRLNALEMAAGLRR